MMQTLLKGSEYYVQVKISDVNRWSVILMPGCSQYAIICILYNMRLLFIKYKPYIYLPEPSYKNVAVSESLSH